jgi:hypothetical protein
VPRRRDSTQLAISWSDTMAGASWGKKTQISPKPPRARARLHFPPAIPLSLSLSLPSAPPLSLSVSLALGLSPPLCLSISLLAFLLSLAPGSSLA